MSARDEAAGGVEAHLSDERLDKLASAYGKLSFEKTYAEIASAFRELKTLRARDQASSAMLGALEAAIDRCELFLSTFEDVGDCATRADISDWIDAAKAARSAGIETEEGG